MKAKYLFLLIPFTIWACRNGVGPEAPFADRPNSVDHPTLGKGSRYLDEVFSNLTTTSNIAYSESIDENGQMQTHYLDIYEPQGDTEQHRPVIIWAPGGGFSKADRGNKKIKDFAKTFAKRGYVTAVIDYRVREGQHYDGTEPEFPQVVREAQYDGSAAVRWFRANAGQYRIDANRICFGGISAGAFVALDVTYNYEDTGDNNSNAGYASNTVAAVDISGAMIDDAVMATGDPPVIIFHGTSDSKVPFSEAQEIEARAQAVGVTYEFNAYQGEGHNLYKNYRDDIVTRTANFLYNNVIAGSQPPVADAGPDQTVADSDGTGTETVTLDGSNSSDPDGSITAYEWVEGTTVLGTTVTITHAFSVGVHTINLTVTDNEGNTGSDAVVVTVHANQAPTADAGPDQTVTDRDGDGGEVVTLDGSGSSDADGTIVAYEWKEGTMILGTSAVITTTLALGSHTLTLTVTDNGGATSSDNINVDVTEFVNQAPVADAGPDQNVSDSDGDGVESVTLDGTGSYDSDGTITAYEWKEGTSILGTTAVITSNLTTGSHTITLTVTDDLGATGSDQVIITVNPNQAPTADAGADQSASVNSAVSFDGTGSSDPDGSIVSYAWDFGDGSTGSGATANHAYSAAGTYSVTLTVTDNGGLTAQDIATVTVTDTPSDVVTIIKAEYDAGKRKLNVEATSNMSPDAVLTVEGFGTMQYESKKDKYKFKKQGVDNPGTVTVTSSLGGTDTATVRIK